MADKAKELTWDELRNVKVGTILHDAFDEGVRFVVLRSSWHLCAYVGIPSAHPLAGQDYENVPINCHGGLTYASEGDGKYLPAGFFWYGWDYAHAGDATFSDVLSSLRESGKKWDVKEVIADSWSPCYDFKKLMRLAESIATKYMGWRTK